MAGKRAAWGSELYAFTGGGNCIWIVAVMNRQSEYWQNGLIDDVGWFAYEANRGLLMGQAEVEKGVKGGWIFTMLFCLSSRHALE